MCKQETHSIAADAESPEDMLAAEQDLVKTAALDPRLYHFCFYALSADLDERMRRGGALFDDVADEFFVGMRALWILGRALDAQRRIERYFTFVQGRYMQLSREVFGRSLEVHAEPLTQVPRPAR